MYKQYVLVPQRQIVRFCNSFANTKVTLWSNYLMPQGATLFDAMEK